MTHSGLSLKVVRLYLLYFVMLFPEIRLKEYGKEAVEVIDNGSGILPANYEALGNVCSVVRDVCMHRQVT